MSMRYRGIKKSSPNDRRPQATGKGLEKGLVWGKHLRHHDRHEVFGDRRSGLHRVAYG